MPNRTLDLKASAPQAQKTSKMQAECHPQDGASLPALPFPSPSPFPIPLRIRDPTR